MNRRFPIQVGKRGRYAAATLPVQPACPQPQAISVVAFPASQFGLQNLLPSAAVQLQSWCAHLLFFESLMSSLRDQIGCFRLFRTVPSTHELSFASAAWGCRTRPFESTRRGRGARGKDQKTQLAAPFGPGLVLPSKSPTFFAWAQYSVSGSFVEII
jgi:hypothetical protein